MRWSRLSQSDLKSDSRQNTSRNSRHLCRGTVEKTPRRSGKHIVITEYNLKLLKSVRRRLSPPFEVGWLITPSRPMSQVDTQVDMKAMQKKWIKAWDDMAVLLLQRPQVTPPPCHVCQSSPARPKGHHQRPRRHHQQAQRNEVVPQ